MTDWLTEECGMCIYATNDAEGRFFTHLHVVESEDFETEEFATADEAKEYIEEIIIRKLNDGEELDDALTEWAEENDTYASYHVFEIVDD